VVDEHDEVRRGEAPAVAVPFPPMEAELVRDLPEGEGWQYEPKWDGFRGVLENVGGGLRLWSRNGRPLLRYFPELLPLGDLLAPTSALDGEIVIARDGVLDFDAMQTRLHPAESRIRKLSAEIPATFIAFDVLLWEGEELWRSPLSERRDALEARAGEFRLSPATRDRSEALRWLSQFEVTGLDGVIAKRLASAYVPGSREAVVKVKPEKTADCIVVGLRRKADGDRIATLLLGIYGDDGEIDYVGSAAVAAGKHDDIAARVLPLLVDAPERRFSEPNRWSAKGGGLEESGVRPELVCEVRYDKVQGKRFRHGTRFLRWRPDKDPQECTWEHLLPRRRPGNATVESLLARRPHG
jgi:ATP-dependent DNA ligase